MVGGGGKEEHVGERRVIKNKGPQRRKATVVEEPGEGLADSL